MGALVGSIVGDALGAPFEFRPAGTYSRRFPEPVLRGHGEMVGGGGWQPGEWTDDTQMSLLVAESLLACGGLDEADLYRPLPGVARGRSQGRRHPNTGSVELAARLGRIGARLRDGGQSRGRQRITDAHDTRSDRVRRRRP